VSARPPAQSRPPRAAAARVTRWLREAILSGQLARAERLSEPAVSAQLGVSRGPVREAFQRLAGERLLTVVPRVGTFIAPITAEDVHDIFELRTALEGLAVRTLAHRLPDEDKRALTRHVNALRQALREDDLSAAGALARGFHEMLAEGTGNVRLREVLERLGNEIRWIRTPSSPVRLRENYRAHLRIAEAILQGKPADAERLMARHLGDLQAAQLIEVRRRPPAHRAAGRARERPGANRPRGRD
jgi:DNA-binding GntR family transcriptional regulator